MRITKPFFGPEIVGVFMWIATGISGTTSRESYDNVQKLNSFNFFTSRLFYFLPTESTSASPSCLCAATVAPKIAATPTEHINASVCVLGMYVCMCMLPAKAHWRA